MFGASVRTYRAIEKRSFDDCVDAEAFAREVLEDIFGELGNGESETIIIERTQMLRSEFNKLEDA